MRGADRYRACVVFEGFLITGAQMRDKTLALCLIALIRIARGRAHVFDFSAAIATHHFFGMKSRLQAKLHLFVSGIALEGSKLHTAQMKACGDIWQFPHRGG